MKKIAIFSGAGLDKESGITTFRDANNGTWNNYNIDEVCTPAGWKKNREKVLDFYNERRSQLKDVEPNDAHKQLVQLEEKFNVVHITQNVSDLLERAEATNVIHLHGELTKVRGEHFSMDQQQIMILFMILVIMKLRLVISAKKQIHN